MSYKIFISAGDLSGEIHASNLVREIKGLNPSCFITAVGGDNLKSVSDNFIEDIVNINAFGFFPVKQIFFLKKTLEKIEQYFLREKPDKVILTDYYGFHIHAAKAAKKFNIPVYYYISPQVWASRSGRIKKLAAVVKKMLVILPFEEKLYKDAGVDSVFVGNPLIDMVPQKTNFDISKPPIIGLFPGSRKSVIQRHMPIILETAEILRKGIGAEFILFNINKNIKSSLPDYIKLEIDNDFEKRKRINFAICPSGTVSLENALSGIPMAVMYKLSYFNYFLIRMIATVKYITLANILANRQIVPEFIQFDAKPDKIASEVIHQLKPENYLSKSNELLEIRKMLGKPGVSKRAAEIILND
ncbi:MAG: lipid-A-disaccharide synthase [Endomicrobium sp.]|jgi:lipid-A-disaccharide synthase|nr:lipid-A-disaccharide synthase [Endomicrobium sp.]